MMHQNTVATSLRGNLADVTFYQKITTATYLFYRQREGMPKNLNFGHLIFADADLR